MEIAIIGLLINLNASFMPKLHLLFLSIRPINNKGDLSITKDYKDFE